MRGSCLCLYGGRCGHVGSPGPRRPCGAGGKSGWCRPFGYAQMPRKPTKGKHPKEPRCTTPMCGAGRPPHQWPSGGRHRVVDACRAPNPLRREAGQPSGQGSEIALAEKGALFTVCEHARRAQCKSLPRGRYGNSGCVTRQRKRHSSFGMHVPLEHVGRGRVICGLSSARRLISLRAIE